MGKTIYKVLYGSDLEYAAIETPDRVEAYNVLRKHLMGYIESLNEVGWSKDALGCGHAVFKNCGGDSALDVCEFNSKMLYRSGGRHLKVDSYVLDYVLEKGNFGGGRDILNICYKVSALAKAAAAEFNDLARQLYILAEPREVIRYAGKFGCVRMGMEYIVRVYAKLSGMCSDDIRNYGGTFEGICDCVYGEVCNGGMDND